MGPSAATPSAAGHVPIRIPRFGRHAGTLRSLFQIAIHRLSDQFCTLNRRILSDGFRPAGITTSTDCMRMGAAGTAFGTGRPAVSDDDDGAHLSPGVGSFCCSESVRVAGPIAARRLAMRMIESNRRSELPSARHGIRRDRQACSTAMDSSSMPTALAN